MNLKLNLTESFISMDHMKRAYKGVLATCDMAPKSSDITILQCDDQKCDHVLLCLLLNQSAIKVQCKVNIVVVGCNADMKICEYVISGHTFVCWAVKINI